MSRFPPIVLFLSAVLAGGCASRSPLSAWSASETAARLANEECRREFGRAPFAGEDFEAVLEGGRWRWGTGEDHVDGFRAAVSFGRYGEGREVSVAPVEPR